MSLGQAWSHSFGGGASKEDAFKVGIQRSSCLFFSRIPPVAPISGSSWTLFGNMRQFHRHRQQLPGSGGALFAFNHRSSGSVECRSSQSEIVIGEWMKARENRDQIVLATKYTISHKNEEQGIKLKVR